MLINLLTNHITFPWTHLLANFNSILQLTYHTLQFIRLSTWTLSHQSSHTKNHSPSHSIFNSLTWTFTHHYLIHNLFTNFHSPVYLHISSLTHLSAYTFQLANSFHSEKKKSFTNSLTCSATLSRTGFYHGFCVLGCAIQRYVDSSNTIFRKTSTKWISKNQFTYWSIHDIPENST